MSRHRRGRITVQHQPTGAARGMMRFMGLIHASMGILFVVVSVTAIFPMAGLFGLPFFLGGAFFAVNGIRMLVGKNDFAHRVGYDIETDVQQETIVGLMDDVDELAAREPHSPAAPSPALNAKERLRQLTDLKDAGLITQQEFDRKRSEILEEL